MLRHKEMRKSFVETTNFTSLLKVNTKETHMKSALEGTIVLDFTRHMSGPYSTLLLADFGVDVIKVASLPHGESVTKPNKKTSLISQNFVLLPWWAAASIAKGVYP